MDDDEDILRVNLTRNEHFGYGFSLLGVSGLPHVIYDIVENSPAECEEVRGRESRLHLAKNHPGCYFDLWPVPWQFMIELNVYLRWGTRSTTWAKNQLDPVSASGEKSSNSSVNLKGLWLDWQKVFDNQDVYVYPADIHGTSSPVCILIGHLGVDM